jgi:uncharacterized 2Fe-2S/4Fe-4S cluster protein (DUF4445 family)
MTNTPTTWIKTLQLTPPSLADNTADADRLTDALKKSLGVETVSVSLDLLRRLPQRLRRTSYQARCVLFQDRQGVRLLDVLGSAQDDPAAGLAMDLGTTRVALRLIDLDSGDILAESAFDNPQIQVGPDILTRIHAADNDGGLERLQSLIISELNRALAKLCRNAGLSSRQVYILAMAGNTTMTHFFLGLNPRWIIREPYIPAVNKPDVVAATELNIRINPAAQVFVFPNIGSYFGGDVVAGILYSGLHAREETAMLVDVGTNAEVVLGNRHWLIACAGAAGPALEGGVTRMGMMARPGVIDRVVVHPETKKIDIHTIDDQVPVGICGSGLIDLAAGLFQAGMMDIRGKFVAATCGDRLHSKKELHYFVVVPSAQSGTGADLEISQADLDSLVRSKAAMYTILETITGTVGMALTDIEAFYVAGTFGVFINPESAITIGMIPDLPRNDFKPLGNSSLGGATRVLQSPGAMADIDTIRDRITYLELNVNQDFMNRFSAAKFLPHTDTARFPSVRIPN